MGLINCLTQIVTHVTTKNECVTLWASDFTDYIVKIIKNNKFDNLNIEKECEEFITAYEEWKTMYKVQIVSKL